MSEIPPKETNAMTALAEAIVAANAGAAAERQRYRRKLMRWRLGAAILVIGAIVYAVATGAADPRMKPHIARVAISGVIVDDPERDALFATLGRSDDVKAVILRIDSPGGTTVGGEAIYESIRRLAERKPVVALMGETAASGAYIAALAADHIVARGNTLTASIGVIYTAPNFDAALDSLGVDVLEVRSGALKAAPSPFAPTNPETLAYLEGLIDETHLWFRDLVAERRQLPVARMNELADGRVMTGRMAFDAGLVDAIGGEQVALDWLRDARGVDTELPVVDHKLDDGSGLAAAIRGALGEAQGFSRVIGGPSLWSTAP